MKRRIMSVCAKVGAPVIAVAMILSVRIGVVMAQSWPSGGVSDVRDEYDLLYTICMPALWIFYILITLTIIFVLWAAWLYLKSEGEAEKVKEATKTLTYAAIAVVIALVARSFPFIVASIMWAELDRRFAGC